jgi:hypothetical protein
MENPQAVSRQARSCRPPGPIDLERNSADAIASAMTSSALLSHRCGGSSVQTSPRRNQLRAQLPTAAVTSAASVFEGGTCFRTLPWEDSGCSMWNQTLLPYLVDVKRETPHIVFYYDTRRIERVTGPRPHPRTVVSPPARFNARSRCSEVNGVNCEEKGEEIPPG